jgi:7,8-dihydropterin-6-yl-methyl-4-(beta-D-ribofuranosyl)aminobenzene 5'-phosphate synthase
MFKLNTLLMAMSLLVGVVPGGAAPPALGSAQEGTLKITVLFDNIPQAEGLTTDWGYACLVEGLDETILFDSGASGEILMANIDRLGVDASAVDVIVLSHFHGDHTGGLRSFLQRNADVTIYMPESFPREFQEEVRATGAEVFTVSGPTRLFGPAHSTGEMGQQIIEQSLIVETSRGLVVITGCAHPGILRIVAAARTYLGQDVELVTGGFHLMRTSEQMVQAVLAGLENEGVRRVAPSHCTGEEVIAMFRAAWGDDFVASGCGAVIELPL